MKTLLKSLLVFILLGIGTCCSARTYSYKNKIEVNESTIVKIKVHYRIDSYVDNKAVNKWIFILIDELIEEMQKEYPLENWSTYELTEFKRRLYFQVLEEFEDSNFEPIEVSAVILSS